MAMSLACASPCFAQSPDEATLIEKDRTVVQALQRLPNVDLTKYAKAKESLLRHLRRDVGSDEFFRLVKRFELKELDPELMELITKFSTESRGVEAARVLLDFHDQQQLVDRLSRAEAGEAAAIVTAVGLTGHPLVHDLIAPLVDHADTPPQLRRAAISALGRTAAGKQHLIEAVIDDRFDEQYHVTLANTLLNGKDVELQAKLLPHLKLPAQANAEPMPPLGELLTMTGNAARGAQVFREQGTCIKCHQVGEEGKQVGPALTEIGSKLSREAVFVSILDPSAAISFGYEGHSILLHDGETVTGLLVSQTDEEVTVRTPEALTRTIPRTEIEEIVRQDTSIMPQGLSQQVSPQQLVDVVDYLLTLKKPAETTPPSSSP
jgi:putative heme-binding domain-containing protein